MWDGWEGGLTQFRGAVGGSGYVDVVIANGVGMSARGEDASNRGIAVISGKEGTRAGSGGAN